MKRIFFVLLLAASPGQAALIDRGSGLIFDDVLNITWLQDANYAMTSGFDADGRMTWDEAMAWADGLSYYDATRDVTWKDWRLATEDVNDDNVAVNCNAGNEILCRDAELAYMYFHNGVTADAPGIFSNVVGVLDLVGYAYWSQSESVPSSIVDIMQFSNGAQGFSAKDGDFYSWAVLDGDVGAIPPSTVPLPAGGLLMLTGMFGIALVRKRAALRQSGLFSQ